MVRVGVDTWLWAVGFHEKDLWTIPEARRLGVGIIDFSITEPDEFPLEEAKRLVKENDIEVVTSTVMPESANPLSDDPGIRENGFNHVKGLIDITRELGGKITAGVNYTASGCFSGLPRTQKEVDMTADHIRRCAQYAKDTSDVTIALEPVKRFESHILNRAEQAVELIRMTGMDNVGVHLDTFHMNIEEASFTDAIELCGDKLKYMHLVDSNRGAPGMGHNPWIEIFKALKRIGFDGPTTIETFNPEKMEEHYYMTRLSQRFAETTAELVTKGLNYLNAVNTIVFG